jgi:large subunit ribosomal protein L38
MKLLYNNTEIISGTHLTPLQAHLEPKIEYTANPNKLYTLIMHDPDAVVGNYLHWVVINIPGNAISNGQQSLNYKGPAPPQGSGIHRYIFLVFEQADRINAQSIPESKRAMSLHAMHGLLNADLHLNSTAYFTSEHEKNGGRKRKRNDKSSKTKKRKVRRKKGTRNR